MKSCAGSGAKLLDPHAEVVNDHRVLRVSPAILLCSQDATGRHAAHKPSRAFANRVAVVPFALRMRAARGGGLEFLLWLGKGWILSAISN